MHDAEPFAPSEYREHLVSLARDLGAGPRAERVELAAAVGRVLAEDVVAPADSPRFDNSQMDGYALNADAVGREDRFFGVGPVVPAGTDPAKEYPLGLDRADTVCPIMTGAKLPEGTCAVVPVEKCDPPEFAALGAQVRVPRPPEGQFVRPAASDLRRGETLVSEGRTVTPQTVGALASQNVRSVEVWARPRVLICTGGEEISQSEDLDQAQLPDANGPMLEALAGHHGLEVVQRIVTGDDPHDLRNRLDDAMTRWRPDLVVTSGGISHGAFEVVRQVLEGRPRAWFGHVAQQPGGPQGCAAFAGVPVVALPGNPVSTLVSFRLFVAPLVAQVWGAAAEPTVLAARLSADVEGVPAKTQFRRGRLAVGEDATVSVEVVGGAGSHLLAQSVGADCLIEVPPASHLSGGDVVSVHPLAPHPHHEEQT